MSETTTPAPVENVGRGAAFALLAIPAAVIVFAIIATVFNTISGFVAIIVPYIAAWLYTKGAGAPLTRAGWGPFVGVSIAGILLGIGTAIVAGTYAQFSAVGGNGGLLGAPFLHTLTNQFTGGIGDNAIPILFGLALGAVAIVGVIRGPRTPSRNVAPGVMPPATPPAAAVPPAPLTPPAANQPSPGVMLNGKPVDPNQK